MLESVRRTFSEPRLLIFSHEGRLVRRFVRVNLSSTTHTFCVSYIGWFEILYWSMLSKNSWFFIVKSGFAS